MSRGAELQRALRSSAVPLDGSPHDLDALVDLAGSARFALIGEATHGTHEFYRVRAELTKRLIRERGLRAVALEADWPDARRVDRYVRGRGTDADATEALQGFQRFPQWMWRNADVLDFVGWLRAWNEAQPEARKVGLWGLDLYSLHRSMDAVLAYLRVVDAAAAQRAVQRYECFDQFGADPQSYGYAATFGLEESCEREVVAQLVELQHAAAEYARRDGRLDPDDAFVAEQNARVVMHAERYYRAMFGGRAASWNLRDRHMAATLAALDEHLSTNGRAPARIAVWAHNSHLGDARATDMGRGGELNLGQLVREHHARESVSIGFTTWSGTVTAADDWGQPARRMRVREALSGSWERALHDLDLGNVCVDLRALAKAWPGAEQGLLERAIGVVYRPKTERASHWFHADLPRQFDALLHYDTTRAVEPLERSAEWERGELPDTYPTAL